jgi:hypothetical protein
MHEIVCDTGHFTPTQLLPAAMLRESMNGFARWTAEHVGGWGPMLRQDRYSVVVGGATVEYLESFRFFDQVSFHTRTSLWAVRDGRKLHEEQDFIAGGQLVGRVHLLLIPVKLEDPDLFIARPAALAAPLADKFRADPEDKLREQRLAAQPRIGPQIEEIGKSPCLGRGQETFVLSRHHCELAEQWLYTEIPSLVGQRRDSLAFELGQRDDEIRSVLRKPLRSVSFELTRPYYLFETGTIRTAAHRTPDGVCFVHHLLGADASTEHGAVVERFVR